MHFCSTKLSAFRRYCHRRAAWRLTYWYLVIHRYPIHYQNEHNILRNHRPVAMTLWLCNFSMIYFLLWYIESFDIMYRIALAHHMSFKQIISIPIELLSFYYWYWNIFHVSILLSMSSGDVTYRHFWFIWALYFDALHTYWLYHYFINAGYHVFFIIVLFHFHDIAQQVIFLLLPRMPETEDFRP